MKARAIKPRRPYEMTADEIAFAEYPWFVDNFKHRRYEAITVKLGDFRYTPDFSGVDIGTGQVCFFEVKPINNQHVYTPAARIKHKATAEAFPEYVFYLCVPVKGTKRKEWTITEFENRTRVIEAAAKVAELPGQTNFLGVADE
jgi:hypothetical protein